MKTTTWIGLRRGSYLITEELGGGPFSTTYKGVEDDTGNSVIYKVAARAEEVELPGKAANSTVSLMQFTGSWGAVAPDTAALLLAQAQRLQSAQDKSWLKVRQCQDSAAVTFFSADFFQGKTLRSMLAEGLDSLLPLVECLKALNRLSKQEGFKYHGDLKPDNILVASDSSILLIDPGHFDDLRSVHGNTAPMVVTTPAYYPGLLPNDLLAMGIILHETLTGYNPFAERRSLDEIENARLSDELRQRILMNEMTGNFFYSSLATLLPPSRVNPAITASLESIILKGLGVKFQPDGTLDCQPGYGNFLAFAAALMNNIEGL